MPQTPQVIIFSLVIPGQSGMTILGRNVYFPVRLPVYSIHTRQRAIDRCHFVGQRMPTVQLFRNVRK